MRLRHTLGFLLQHRLLHITQMIHTKNRTDIVRKIDKYNHFENDILCRLDRRLLHILELRRHLYLQSLGFLYSQFRCRDYNMLFLLHI